jgi:hypothetical protein
VDDASESHENLVGFGLKKIAVDELSCGESTRQTTGHGKLVPSRLLHRKTPVLLRLTQV